MRVLITGICGFVGSTLAQGLQDRTPGLVIVGVDNLSRPGSETNVAKLRHRGVDFHHGDILDQRLLEALPKCQWVLDCAANPSVLAGVQGSSSRSVIEQNLYGTVNLLELCRKWQAGFTLLSTSRVYSIPSLAGLPLFRSSSRFLLDPTTSFPPGLSPAGVAEHFSTTAPISLYGSTKLCSEALALEYGEAFQFPVWINRCGVLAGEGQFGKADQGIFSFWIHSWARARRLRFLGFGGTGFQVRDCLHPRDLLGVLGQQMVHTSSPSPAERQSRIANFSGGEAQSQSLRELSDWCEERLGPLPAECDPRKQISSTEADRPFDIPWMILDSTRARQIWDWQPQTPLPNILEEIARHATDHPEWLDLVTKSS